MVNLREKPFYLNDEQVKWVEDTLADMSQDEKIGQVFINMTLDRRPENLKRLVNEVGVGGARWQGGTLEEVYNQNKTYQTESKIPLLIAANCEAGGNSLAPGGTYVGAEHACGASQTEQTVRDMARVGGTEAKAIGCNWTFAPIVDIVYNWRNTIVNNRAFGNDPDQIIELSKAYMDEMHKLGLACAAKHFPGDGSEERDQHLVMGINDFSVEDWDKTYGRVYKEIIDAGVDSIMVGHIALPAYQKKLNPALEDKDIKAATMSKELLQGLLRGQLGFNGLIVTDASHMVGLTASGSRKEVIPGVINAGCDMILFFNDEKEDLGYLKAAVESGEVSQERLDEAVTRILALKASLNLPWQSFPEKEGLEVFGCQEHKDAQYRAADEAITLVKDTQNALPLNPQEKKRMFLYYVQTAPMANSAPMPKNKENLIKELEAAGFEVTAPRDFFEAQRDPEFKASDMWKLMSHHNMEQFKKDYDVVLYVVDMKGYAQTNNVRVNFDMSHSDQAPWSIHEVPTIGVSLNYTNHLYDLPMMKTWINAYSNEPGYLKALVEKIVGQSEFKGKANDLVWCGRWETRV